MELLKVFGDTRDAVRAIKALESAWKDVKTEVDKQSQAVESASKPYDARVKLMQTEIEAEARLNAFLRARGEIVSELANRYYNQSKVGIAKQLAEIEAETNRQLQAQIAAKQELVQQEMAELALKQQQTAVAQAEIAAAKAAKDVKDLKNQYFEKRFSETTRPELTGATSKEMLAYNNASRGLLDVLANSKKSISDIEQLFKDYHAGVKRDYDEDSQIILKHYANVDKITSDSVNRQSEAQRKLAAQKQAALDRELAAITALDKARQKAQEQADATLLTAQRENYSIEKKLKAQQDLSKAAKGHFDTITRTVNAPQVNGKSWMLNASEGELNKYTLAVNEMSRAAAAAGMTHKQVRQLIKDLESGTLQSYDKMTAKVVSYWNAAANQANSSVKRQLADQEKLENVNKGKYDTDKPQSARMFLTWQSVIRIAELQMFHMAVGRLTSSMFEAIRTASELQLRIAEIRTISEDAQYSTNQWTQSVINLSNAFGRDVKDVAEGFYQTISNQTAKGAQAIGFMNEALTFSRVALTSTADAVNLGTAALNSYGRSASSAHEVFAQLMKIIELGRVRGDEMANTFGRMAPTASMLGISLAELGGMIETITVKGIKYSEASTIISNLMQRLMKPSEELTRVFKELGVASGQEAIAAFGGITGLLERLGVEAQKSKNLMGELAAMFPNIRGARGALMLIHDTDQLKDNIIATTYAIDDYNVKVKQAMEPTTVYIQQQTQQLKNYILNDFAIPFIESVGGVSKELGGFVNVFNSLRAAFMPALLVGERIAGMFGGLKTHIADAVTAVVLFRIAWNATTSMFNVTVEENTRRVRLFGFELKSLNTEVKSAWGAAATNAAGFFIQLGINAIISAFTYYVVHLRQLKEEARMAIEEGHRLTNLANTYFQQVAMQQAAVNKNSIAYAEVQLIKSLDNQYKAYYEYYSGVNKLFKGIDDANKLMLKNTETTLSTVFSQVNKRISSEIAKAESEVRKLESALNRIEEDIQRSQLAAEEKVFDNQLKHVMDKPNATADRGAEVIDQRLADIRKQMAQTKENNNISEFIRLRDLELRIMERKAQLYEKEYQEGIRTNNAAKKLQDINDDIITTNKQRILQEQQIAAAIEDQLYFEDLDAALKKQKQEEAKVLFEDLKNIKAKPVGEITDQQTILKEFDAQASKFLDKFAEINGRGNSEFQRQSDAVTAQREALLNSINLANAHKKLADVSNELVAAKEKEIKAVQQGLDAARTNLKAADDTTRAIIDKLLSTEQDFFAARLKHYSGNGQNYGDANRLPIVAVNVKAEDELKYRKLLRDLQMPLELFKRTPDSKVTDFNNTPRYNEDGTRTYVLNAVEIFNQLGKFKEMLATLDQNDVAKRKEIETYIKSATDLLAFINTTRKDTQKDVTNNTIDAFGTANTTRIFGEGPMLNVYDNIASLDKSLIIVQQSMAAIDQAQRAMRTAENTAKQQEQALMATLNAQQQMQLETIQGQKDVINKIGLLIDSLEMVLKGRGVITPNIPDSSKPAINQNNQNNQQPVKQISFSGGINITMPAGTPRENIVAFGQELNRALNQGLVQIGEENAVEAYG